MAKKDKTIIIILVSLVLCCLISALLLNYLGVSLERWLDDYDADCDLRDVAEPEAPIYPDAKFVEEEVIYDAPWGYRVERYYRVSSPMQPVVDFYSELDEDGCVTTPDYVICNGDLESISGYLATINENEQGDTTLKIMIEIDRCGERIYK